MLLALLLAAPAHAVPVQLAHQGRLLDADRLPLDGLHTLELAVYDDPVGGRVLWAEAQDADFTDGYFALTLGADLLNPLDDDTLASGDLWLAMSVDGGPDLPQRLAVNSAPYARLAGLADTATNVIGGVVDVTEVRIDGRTVIDGAGVVDTLAGLDCLPGEVAAWDGAAWACALLPDEPTVEGWITDEPIDLAAGTTIGGEPLDGGPVRWVDLVAVPAGFADDVDDDSFAAVSCDDGQILVWDDLAGRFDCAEDLTLDEASVRAIVGAAPVDLAPGSSVDGVPIVPATWAGLPDRPADLVDGDDDTLAELGCAPGELPAWDGADWTCTSDASLSAEEVRAIVEAEPLDLAPGTTIGGDPVVGGDVAWGDVLDVPADLLDGDADSLADLSCAPGEGPVWDGAAWACAPDADSLGGLGCADGEVPVWTGAIWACAPDADTLSGLGCDAGQIARFDGAAWTCGVDEGVRAEEVPGLIPLDLPAETTIGGARPLTGTVAWDDLTGRPADLVDGDGDALLDLSCAPGELPVWDGVAWDCGALVDRDSLADLGFLCEDTQIPVFDAFEGTWTCADDQVLAADEVLAIVDGADLRLGAGTTLDGAALLTAGDGIPADLLPFDGLEAISNGVLSNRFTSRFSTGGVPIPDNNPLGVESAIVVPAVGIAADLRISVDIENSDISGLALELTAPDGSFAVLYDGADAGADLVASYPDPDAPVSGDLGAWVGADPAGTWTLRVIDTAYLDNTFDGAIVEWAVEVDAYADDAVRLAGDLVVEDDLSVDADLAVAGDLTVDGVLSLANPVDLPEGSTIGGRALLDADNAAWLAPNLLLNGGVDLWQRGDDQMPDGWYPSGGLTYARTEADGRVHGTVTADADDAFVFQKLEGAAEWAGLPITVAIDVAGEAGARVEIDDGVGVTAEDVPPGEGWSRIVLQHTVAPGADRVAVKLVPGTSGALWFDRATLAVGTWTSLPFVPRDPHGELQRARRWYEVGQTALYNDDSAENSGYTWWMPFDVPKADTPDVTWEWVDWINDDPDYYSGAGPALITEEGWFYDQENEAAERGLHYYYKLTIGWTAEVPVAW